MNRQRPFAPIATRTVDRREWMTWIGKSAVLSLAGGALARCAVEPLAVDERPSSSNDSETSADAPELPDGGHDDNTFCAPDAENFPYHPVDFQTELRDRWPSRTVDPQDLEWILQNWRLQVDGMVDRPATLTFEDILGLKRQDQIADFHCVEGWSVYDVPWNGVHLSTIKSIVSAHDSATHITFHTIDGTYNESLPVAVALEPMTLLAYGVDCNTLPLSHGFPLRLVVPRLLAYKSAKYVTRIEFTDHPVEGYWVAVGYPYDGEVPPSRLREGKY